MLLKTTALGLAGLLLMAPTLAETTTPEIGAPAPAFTGTDSHGRAVSLSDFRGKWVVLEWLNHECPYVRKHYNGENMQALQKKYGEKGVVWLSIVSSRPNSQGYTTPEQANALTAEKGAAPSHVLLDPTGVIGKAYGARTTPQMFVINPDGVLLYDGAIDDKPTSRLADLEGAHSYFVTALEEAMAGKPVTRPRTQPYGCTVKYEGVR